MVSVIFLDLDGVLNTYKELGKYGHNYLDPEKIKRIEKIVSATGAKIVISSNWRFDMGLVRKSLPTLSSYIIGNTGITGNRISEIEEWLEGKEVDSYVVIDDLLLLFPDNLVHINDETGITDEDVSKAINILNRDKVEKLACLFEKLAKTPPIYLYHGTHKSNLSSIMSSGLLANPKKRTWQIDEESNFNMSSRNSLEGIYLTPNLMTAYISTNNAKNKKRENPIVIIIQAQRNSLILDEDEINLEMRIAGGSGFQAALSYFGSLFVENSADVMYFVQTALSKIKTKISNTLHPDLENRLTELLKNTAKASIKRKISYVEDYDYDRAWEAYSENNKNLQKPTKPNSSESEAEFKKYQDLITRALKILARNTNPNSDWNSVNARLVENVGFNGNNKIVVIVEFSKDFDSGENAKIIYPADVKAVPEEVLAKLKNDINRSIGDIDIQW